MITTSKPSATSPTPLGPAADPLPMAPKRKYLFDMVTGSEPLPKDEPARSQELEARRRSLYVKRLIRESGYLAYINSLNPQPGSSWLFRGYLGATQDDGRLSLAIAWEMLATDGGERILEDALYAIEDSPIGFAWLYLGAPDYCTFWPGQSRRSVNRWVARLTDPFRRLRGRLGCFIDGFSAQLNFFRGCPTDLLLRSWVDAGLGAGIEQLPLRGAMADVCAEITGLAALQASDERFRQDCRTAAGTWTSPFVTAKECIQAGHEFIQLVDTPAQSLALERARLFNVPPDLIAQVGAARLSSPSPSSITNPLTARETLFGVDDATAVASKLYADGYSPAIFYGEQPKL